MSQELVRAAREDDLESLTAIYNHYILSTAITFDLEPYTVEARRETWFSHYAATGRHRLLVVEDAGRVQGYCCSSTFRPKGAYASSVETSVYLAPEVVRRGLGTRLYGALFEVLRDEDVHRAYAGITLPNPASIALHQRFGFASVGLYHEVGRKLGKYWNVEWYEKRLTA
jgi:phosphinothricin acetyltransferase